MAEPRQGLMPLLRDAVVRAALAWARQLEAAGQATAPADRLVETMDLLADSAHEVLVARNQAARTPPRPAHGRTVPAPAAYSSPSRPRRR
ncbi:hypothetical protein [Streptomyces sp. NPDC090994]|uniref:hypothetical protein n=1 Tax=Streptomyces sp. NPDC090994 TaxID=3365969 RepID=UPI00380B592F